MRFYRPKIDINDKLFSQLVRFGKDRCDRCNLVRNLQTAHIFSRKYYNTRFYRRNAVALCARCHDWFDSHKLIGCIFDERKQVLSKFDEGFHWLVFSPWGYTWDELQRIYVKSQMIFTGYSYKKKLITKQLKKELKDENSNSNSNSSRRFIVD